ncbi:hypothetical protein HY992_05215 [Candidatus Micrarchaeota archaeon]|nr:hypothetical protein [Candidatus Micrarchaeota archaeon]
MAKPIQPTPILSGEDAKRFLENMAREQEAPSLARVAFIREALSDSRKFVKK